MDHLHIVHDEPFLVLGPDARSIFTWAWLKETAEHNAPVYWDMLGEIRALPPNIVQDAWRVVEEYMKLIQLGRTEEAPCVPWGFTRQQTVPLSEIESEASSTSLPQSEKQSQSEPTCPRSSNRPG